MKKASARRRVKTAHEDGDQDSGPTIVSRSVAKKKSKLSFSNDLDGGEDDDLVGMKGAVMKREERNEEDELDFLSAKRPIVLGDLGGSLVRPSYGKEELNALRTDSAPNRQREEPVIVMAGDELDELEEQQIQAEEEDGDDIHVPMVDQIRVAREIRERLKKQQSDDFVPLSEKDAEEEESRLIRDKSDDSDEPFEEHRGDKLKFGAPVGPEKHVMVSGGLNDSVVNDWELELIRSAAGSDVGMSQQQQQHLMNEFLSPAPSRRAPARDLPILSATSKATNLHELKRAVDLKVAEAVERVRVVQGQLANAEVVAQDAAKELPKATDELAKRSIRFNFVQKVRDYTLNLIACLEQHVLPQVEAFEKSGSSNVPDLFENVSEEYRLQSVLSSFDSFRMQYSEWYYGAHIDDCLVELVEPFIRYELLAFVPERKLTEWSWFNLLASFGDPNSPKTDEVFLKILHNTLVRRLEMFIATGDANASMRVKHLVEDLIMLFESKPSLLQPLLDKMKVKQ